MNFPFRIARRRLPPLAVVASAVLFGACASAPPPTTSLDAARTAIGTAERADAGRYATPELTDARTKLAAADSAVELEKMKAAERLAEQARVAAELATAKAAQARAMAVNDEMKASNAALIEELQRNTGTTQ